MSIGKAEEKLSELLNTQNELKEQSAELKHLIVMEREYDLCSKKVVEIQAEIEKIQSVRAGLDLSTPQGASDAVACDRQLARLEHEYADYKHKMDSLKKTIESLKYIVENNKNFDKSRLFRNIRKLLSSSSIKLGQLEKEAGCQPGYMSRLEKIGNTTDPSMEFVVTVAKELEVSIDLLVYGDFEKMTPTELYVLKFLYRLIKDTKDDNMVWKTNDMYRYMKSYKEKVSKNESLTSDLTEINYGTRSAQYTSLFSGKVITCSGNCYVGGIKGSDAAIYIMSCVDNSGELDTADRFFEIYIENQSKLNPLLCTAQTSEALTTVVNQLYDVVEIAVTHIHINDDVRDIIDSYLNLPTEFNTKGNV